MRLVPLAALALPAIALAGPFTGYTALGEMGIDTSDASGLSTTTFTQQIADSGVVGPGIESEIIPPYVWGDFSDVDATLTLGVNTWWAGAPFIFNGLRFSLTDPGAPSLAGAYLISTTIPGFTAAQITSAGSMVAINFSGTSSVGEVVIGFDAGPTLTLGGTCPGAGTATFAGFTPSGTIAIARGSGAGSTRIPSGPCAGTALPIANPRLVSTITADASGGRTMAPTFPGSLCGAPVVAVDMATCAVTPVATIP